MTDHLITRHALDIANCPPEHAVTVARAHYAESVGEIVALVEKLMDAAEGHDMLNWADRVQSVRQFVAAFKSSIGEGS